MNRKIQDVGNDYNGKFSLIVCNPPYMETNRGFKDEKEHIAVARTELTLTFKELFTAVKKALKFGGRFAFCCRADRLVDAVSEMRANGIEPKRLQFVSGGKKEPYLFLMEGVKGGKIGIKILKTLEN